MTKRERIKLLEDEVDQLNEDMDFVVSSVFEIVEKLNQVSTLFQVAN